MIKEYLILIFSIICRPLLPVCIHKLNHAVVHIAFFKMGGLSKFIDSIGNIIIYSIHGYVVLQIRGIPFFLGRKSYTTLNKYVHCIPCIYHVHQLSHDAEDDWEFLKDKHYIITIHDYFWICERFFMLDENYIFCNRDMRCCTRSLLPLKLIMNGAKYRVIPDTSMNNYLDRFYDDEFIVIPHGVKEI